jgi:hypothetical protein
MRRSLAGAPVLARRYATAPAVPAAATRRLAGAIAFALALAACGGGGGGTRPPGSTPPPGDGGGGAAASPCQAALGREIAAPAAQPTALASSKSGSLGDTGWSRLDAAWIHAVNRARIAARQPEVSAPRDRDAGDIAVFDDAAEVLLPANQFDLGGRGLRFVPNARGGYDRTADSPRFRTALGSRLTLADDDAEAVSVRFPFPFYGRTHDGLFVNSDGNLTFERADTETTPRNVTRFLQGPPRIAVFFADLDPGAGGAVFVNAASEALTVTWCLVPGFESSRIVTAQASLLPDGSIELVYDAATTLLDAIVGLSPGRTTAFTPVDLSGAGLLGSDAGAIGERFSQSVELDVQGVAQRFYRSHPDAYDQLVIFTDQRAIRDAFAFELTVANRIRGLGIDLFDASREFGSPGALQSVVVMDSLGKYPDDPLQRVRGENTTVSLLGQEAGHRWLAFLRFVDHDRRISDALLGRDQAHWSFFFDSDASVMEGNDIEDLGGGRFRTVQTVSRYSRLDLYAMGLVDESQVPPFFYVESPVNVDPPVSGPEAAPRTGVTFNGTRRDVLIQDVIDAMGRRDPPASQAPKVHRQAFVYVLGAGRSADAAQIDKLERIRRAWEAFYAQAVEGFGRVETRLRPPG